jgi:hypothetical protein
MGVLGAPVYRGGAIKRIYKYLSHLSMLKWIVYRFLMCSLWEVLIQSRPHTVPLGGRKSRTLELLAFDEYCRFDTFAFF